MALKIYLRALFPGCFTSKSHQRVVSERHVCKTSQTQRLSLSDIISDQGSAHFSMDDLANSLLGSKLHVFKLEELESCARGFSYRNYLGGGGFGPVYKGYIDENIIPGLDAQPVAIKLLDLNGPQGQTEWLAEVVFLGQLRHSNIVNLIGYCYEDEQRVLVYEYMAKGNLENQLFGRYSISLPWLVRMKIALDAARGLAFLHGEDKPIIYRDFKTSNILLDSDYNAKLSDFGLARDGPKGDETCVTTCVMGTHGYGAPEYVKKGLLTTKSDVYSYGVVLLEVLTGRRVLDENRPCREKNLVQWARPLLKDPQKLDRFMDPNLGGEYSTEGAIKAAALARKCLNYQAKYRPKMDYVVKILESILNLKDIPFRSFVCIVTTEGESVNVTLNTSR